MYRISEKNTLNADQMYWVQGDVAHISPDVLYPAWEGLLTDNTAYTFTDSSASAHGPIRSFGDVHHTTRQKKVDATSMTFQGISHYLKVTGSAAMSTSGDYTIEFWIKMNSVNQNAEIWDWRRTGSTGGSTNMNIRFNSGGIRIITNSDSTFDTGEPLDDLDWHHVAIVRASATIRVYFDGVVDSTTIGSSTATTTDSSIDYTTLGAGYGGTDNGNFYIDEIRYVVGTAVYTGAFTPPTALTTSGGTYASGTNLIGGDGNFTASNTKLLIHSDAGGHSGAYGTDQADGHKYYYTDIKGSKPIKDPRIGAHFGSQRHKFKSLQLLKQETATHGKDIFSVDGREWCRANSTGGGWLVQYASHSNYIQASDDCTGCFLEITGYFNDINFMLYTYTGRCNDIDISVNGALSVDGSTTLGGLTTVSSPLVSRYVDASSVINGGDTLKASLGTTPAINTVRYEAKTGASEYIAIFGIELIAQDRTSTATKSQIQIPSQNVVSFGKKFTVAETKHYNPFAFKTDGTTAWTANNHNSTSWPVGTGSSTNIDTATSLGLAAWVSTNYYYPYNGGRVVKWIASDGTIKTSVNMMPPNARNISSTAASEKGDDSGGTTSAAATNSLYTPTFTDIAIDHSQAEVAKTFHWREFGNGAANGGSTGATWADASTLATAADDIAYVMDDGLTSFQADDVRVWPNISGDPTLGGDKTAYFTFIGTGLTLKNTPNQGTLANAIDNGTYAQNLPYGTHIFEYTRNDSSGDTIKIDGVTVHTDTSTNGYLGSKYWNIHQPKMPPIPEDAVVIADYMLMADFVITGSAGLQYISKGVRRVDSSRDIFYNAAATITPYLRVAGVGGFRVTVPSHSSARAELPAFCTNQVRYVEDVTNKYQPYVINGSTVTPTAKTGTGGASFYNNTGNEQVLGLNIHKTHGTSNAGWDIHVEASDVVSPIHTSSHYQSFETLFLHELVGGDRNMEQTNLVVTPDGKTWDQVTRDTSYLGKEVLCLGNSTTEASNAVLTKYDHCRGLQAAGSNNKAAYNKDSFALGYDRFICLKAGSYSIHVYTMSQTGNYGSEHARIYINGALHGSGYTSAAGTSQVSQIHYAHLDRGDYVQIYGRWYASHVYSGFWIERI